MSAFVSFILKVDVPKFTLIIYCFEMTSLLDELVESFLWSNLGASTLTSLGASFISSTDELELLEEEEDSLLRMVGFSKLGRFSSKSSDSGLVTVIGAAGCIGTGSMLELEELW